MNTNFRKFLSYLLVLTLICSNLSVPALAEEVSDPVITPAATAAPEVQPAEPSPVNTLTLPAALRVIEEEAFAGSTSIGRVVIPEGAVSIEARAFADSSLSEIVLPSTLGSIASDAFSGCSGFTVVAEEGTFAYDWAVEKGYIEAKPGTPAEYFKTEVLDDGTLSITGYTGPEEVMNVPDTINGLPVTAIESCAFWGRAFTQVILPEGLTHIYSEAFAECGQLESITLPSTLRHIGDYAFAHCISLSDMAIPSGVTHIGSEAFWDCTSLTSITVPGGVETLSYGVFGYCDSLTEVTLSEGITGIGGEAFWGCCSLEQIDLPDSLVSIEEYAFYGCTGLTSISIPANVAEIGSNPFAGCTSLTSITVDAANADYCAEDGILYNADKTAILLCTAAKTGNLVIADSVETIHNNAFDSCLLSSVTIPASVTDMAYGVFEDCSAVVYVYPNTYAAEWCLENSQPFTYLYSEEADFLYTVLDHGTASVTGYTGEGGMIVIPSQLGGVNVTAIAANAFNGNENITGVKIPEGVTSIGDGAFSNCANPVSISIPASVISIGTDMFTGGGGFSLTVPSGSYAEQWCADNGFEYTQAGAEHLEYEIAENGSATITRYSGYDREFAIPATLYGHPVTAIGEQAFFDTYNLTRVTIPASVVSISSRAFMDASTRLTAIEVDGANPAYADEDGVLYNKDKTMLLAYPMSKGRSFTVPAGVTDIGSYAFAYGRIDEITLPDGLLSIGTRAFHESDLNRIVIPDSVTYIADRAFSGCYSLRTLSLPASLTTLEERAFAYCESLTEVVLPDSLTTMGMGAFAECYSLGKITFGSGLTEIPDSAFYSVDLSDLVVPEGITSIGIGAFAEIGLKSVSLPSTLTTLGENAFAFNRITSISLPAALVNLSEEVFYGCDALTEITVDEANPTYKSVGGVLLTKDGTRLICCPGAKSGSYEIPAGVTSIAQSAFYHCWQLGSVVVPEGVTALEGYTFADCYALSSVTLPASIESIGDSTFENSSNVIIYAPEGSYALNWAIQHGFVYEEGILESDHPYANAEDKSWTYTHDSEAAGLAVTFSGKTQFESNFDYLHVIDANGESNSYSGSELAGATLILPGNSFSLRLTSDESETRFGFRITKIKALSEEEYETLYLYDTSTLEDGTLQIIRYNGTAADLVIPSEISGMPVSMIGDNAFHNNDNLTSIVIPDSVTSIGIYAFFSCNALTEITIPEGVASIGESAFNNCQALTEITIPEGVTSIGNSTFGGCYNLTAISLPSTLTTIDYNAFYNCSSLTEVTIPEGVTSIGASAFADCYNLAKISLPSSLTFIDDSAFAYDSNLTVIAPEGSYAYEWADRMNLLPEIAIIESAHPYENNTDESWEYTHPEEAYALVLTFSSKTRFESNWDYLHVIDGEGEEVRYTGSSLTGRSIAVKGNSFTLRLTSDSSQTYYGFSLTGIRPLTEEEYLNFGEFTYSTKEDGTLSITGYTGFRTELEIPAEIDGVQVTAISSNAFSNSHLTSIVIPDSVTQIGYGAFSNCSSLTSVSLPAGLTGIEYDTFHQCRSLTEISLPAGLTYIRQNAFYYCSSLTEVIIPDGVTEIDGSAFSNCSSLTSVSLPAGLTYIRQNAFYDCSSLTEITIPEGVTSIGASAFADCYNLETVSLPASLTFIDDNAFAYDSKLTVIAPKGSYAYEWADRMGLLPEVAIIESAHPYAPNTDESWTHSSDSADTYAHLVTFSRKTQFYNGDWLTITDGSGNAKEYRWADLMRQTVCVPGNSFTLTLRSDEYDEAFGFMVTAIVPLTEEEFLDYGEFTYYDQGDGALAITGYTGFNPNLVIPAEIDGMQVTAIGSSAFSYKEYLESVVIPEGVTTIGTGAFISCSNLTAVTLPSSLTFIGESAFNNCQALTQITIPEGVISIGESAFRTCSSLTEVTIPEGITSIGNSTFGECYNLAAVSLPSSLTSVGEYAFYNCNSLTEVTIPEGVTEIGYRAFADCYNLTAVNLPSTLTAIDNNAFAYDSKLTITAPEGSYAYQWAYDHNYLLLSDIGTEHPYAPDTNQTWEFVSDKENTYAIAIAFARGSYLSSGDRLTITDAAGNVTNYYYSDLDNQTVIVYSDAVTLNFTSDSWYEGYGFTVTRIEALTRDEFINHGHYTACLRDDGTYELTGYTGYSTDLVLPSEIDGISVTAISGGAFQSANGGEKLISVVIPDSITCIGDSAFLGCMNLTSVTLPAGLTRIEPYTFNECRSLPEITIPDGVTSIGYCAFGNCYDLTSVVLPESLTDVNYDAFSGSNYVRITAPEESYAYNWAYEHNYLYLTGIESDHPINTAAEQVWEYTHDGDAYALKLIFSRNTDCPNTQIFVRDSAGREISYYVSELRENPVYIEGNSFTLRVIPNEYDAGLYGFAITKIETMTEEEYVNYGGFSYYEVGDGTIAVSGYSGLMTDVVIPAEIDGYPVSQIGEYIFNGRRRITSVTIPEGVLLIGEAAFSVCPYLTTVSLPSTLTHIGNSAFASSGLTQINLPDGLISIGPSAFSNCDQLTEVAIPGSVTDISEDAFMNCDRLNRAVFLDGATTIGSHMFYNCTSLTEVVIPESMTQIGPEAFRICEALTDVTINGTQLAISDYAFDNCSNLTNVTIGEGVTSIGYRAFGSCSSLTAVRLPASLEFIDDGAFEYAGAMGVIAPEGSYAYNWASERDMLYEESVLQSAHPYADYADETWDYISEDENAAYLLVTFSQKTYFESGYDWLHITDSTGLSKNYSGDSLAGRTLFLPGNSFTLNLTSDSSIQSFGFRITRIEALTEEEAANYAVYTTSVREDGTLAITDYEGGVRDLIIPAEIDGVPVTAIMGEVFFGETMLTSVVVPEGVNFIETSAFNSCFNLASVSLPETLASMGSSVFANCTSLTGITIPGSLSAIPDWTFYNCTSLAEVTLMEGVNGIENYAFDTCPALTRLNLPASLNYLYDSSFLSNSGFTITAPVGSYAYNWAASNNVLYEEAVIESAHPYATNEDMTLEYTAENPDAYAIVLTFSPQTYFEDGCDFLTITDASGSAVSYTGNALAGIVLPVMGNALTLQLTSDGSNECFGFRITRIEELSEQEYLNYAHYDTRVLSDDTVAITGYSGFRSEIAIPSEIDGRSVSMIDAYAFRNNQTLYSVSIPASVTTIGNRAFESCYQLTALTLPEGLTALEDYAFASCTSLTSIEIPGTVSAVGTGAFNDCSALTSATIGEGVSSIGSSAFNSCGQLCEISLPVSLTGIGNHAFSNCNSLTDITIPGDMQAIGDYAFFNCLNLTEVNLQGATSIGEYAFASCPNLSVIDLPYGLTSIGYGAFEYCYQLGSVNFPTTLESIAGAAFQQCNSLTEITIPASVLSLGENIFSSCASLSRVTVEEGVTRLPNYLFASCEALTSVSLPEGLTSIGYGAFEYCYALSSIAFPSTLETLEGGVFYYCNSLTGVVLPESLASIGTITFHGCGGLTEITIPGSVSTIPDGAFSNCLSLRKVTVSEGTETIMDSAFANCPVLETVNLPESLTQISDGAFSESYNAVIAAPEGSRASEWAAAHGLVSESSVLESSHPYAAYNQETWEYTYEDESAYALLLTFSARTQLEQSYDHLIITSGDGTEQRYTGSELAGQTIGVIGPSFTVNLTADGSGQLFGFRITKVEALTEEEFLNYGEFTYYYQADGSLAIDGYTGFNPNLVIPAEIDGMPVAQIASGAFSGNSRLISVVIPEGVTLIENEAFANCQSLQAVSLPTSLREIYSYAFSNCSSLTAVALPDGITLIGSSAFQSCSALTEITVPGSVTTIESYAFSSCTGLTSAAIGEGVSSIYYGAFGDCPALTNVTLPASLTTIESYNFYSDTVSVTAPEGSYAHEWALLNGLISGSIVLESAHPYSNNMNETWEYTHSSEAYALAVTFSSRTQFESGYDRLIVTDANGTPTTYTGSSLSGQTIALMGNSFTLNLTSDGSQIYYGFSIVRVEALTEEEYLNFGV